MFSFTGYKCPVCGQPFADGDDIVVCPDCGAPYHRECYAKTARCLFEERHGPDFEWTPSEEDRASAQSARTLTCPSCGTKCPADSQFCLHCGTPLSPEAAQTRAQAADPTSPEYVSQVYRSAFGTDELDGIPVHDWEVFIGRASAVYMTMFGRMKQTGHKISMNLSAFLLGPVYFYFRKMWKAAALFTALDLLLTLPNVLVMLFVTGSAVTAGMNPDSLASMAQFCGLMSWVVMILRGMYAHHLYRKEAGERIRRISAQVPAGPDRDRALRQSGGVSWLWALVYVMALLTLGSSLSLLVGPNVSALLGVLGA